MPVVIQDDRVRANINERGAQITSLYNKDTNIEYIWPADEKYWLWHAPILFPIEGKLKDGTCYIDGKDYHIGQHGFARDEDFDVIDQQVNKVTLVLNYSNESLKMFPYKFKLIVTYEIIDGILKTHYEVENVDDKDMYFTVGSHPGFNLPLTNDTEYDDYYVNLSLDYKSIPLDQNGFVDVKNEVSKDEKNIDLTRNLFKNDALVFDFNDQNVVIKILNHKNDHGVEVSSDNAKYWGLWSCYPKEGKFVCVEPWWGITDTVSADQDFTHKFGNNLIHPSEKFDASYNIKAF